MKLFRDNFIYAPDLTEGRRITAEELKHYNPANVSANDFMPEAGAGFVTLSNIGAQEASAFIGSREPDGEFVCGGANRAFIITDAEWDALVALNAQRAAEKAARQNAEQLAWLTKSRSAAERQRDANGGTLPTEAEARAKERAYNALYNEGGEGYVPHFYSAEEYAGICRRIAELEG